MPEFKEYSPAAIRRVIQEEEIPLRSRAFAPAAVDEIFRYGAIVGNSIEHHDRLDRGMDRARELIRAAEGANISFPSGTVILADELQQGKGRFTRSWHAPKGGLWLTLVMVNTLLPENSLLLPIAAGIACCEVLQSLNIKARIKWVNDVLVNGKKIAGVLTESFTSPRFGEEYILIGIGINVNNSCFPADLSEQATSVKLCLNRELELKQLTLKLLAKLSWNIGLLYYDEAHHLEKHGGIGQALDQATEKNDRNKHPLLERYEVLTDVIHRRVLFGFNVLDNPQFEAKVVGVDNSGGLLLELDDKTRIIQYSGEIIYLD